jgi:hypothetical protein
VEAVSPPSPRSSSWGPPDRSGGVRLRRGATVAVLLALAGRSLRDGGFRLILAGIAVSFLTAALINLLMRAKVEEARLALLWLTGSLSSTPWWQVVVVVIVIIALLPALVVASRWLPLVQLGRESAHGLGVASAPVRLVVVTSAVLLTAVTCAFVGPISFIAPVPRHRPRAPAARRRQGRHQRCAGRSSAVGRRSRRPVRHPGRQHARRHRDRCGRRPLPALAARHIERTPGWTSFRGTAPAARALAAGYPSRRVIDDLDLRSLPGASR